MSVKTMTPLEKAHGDDAVEASDDLPMFQKMVKDCKSDLLDRMIKPHQILKQYMRFYLERRDYKRLESYQKQLMEAGKYKERLFGKNLALYKDKKTVIIGLEDILIAVSTEPLPNYDLEAEMSQAGISIAKVYAKLRPYLFDFLDFLADRFEVIVFCTGSEFYCSAMLDAIESKRRYFAHRAYNDHVLFENCNYVIKDYNFLFTKDRSKDNTIIVEHSVATFCMKMYNGILVPQYVPENKANSGDLVELAKCLEDLNSKPSVKTHIKGVVSRKFI